MRVTVLSPHLDDAVFSLGATLAALAQAGLDVAVTTVFAGDLDRDSAPSYWDAQRGQATAASVFAERRAEDRNALSLLGVAQHCLPFDDAGYVARRDPEIVWSVLEPCVARSDMILIPGFPLVQPDHRWLAMFASERIDRERLGFYAELPYAVELVPLAKSILRGRTSRVLNHLAAAPIVWKRPRTTPTHRAKKAEAIRCYEHEVSALGCHARLTNLWDQRFGLEAIAFTSRSDAPESLDPVLR